MSFFNTKNKSEEDVVKQDSTIHNEEANEKREHPLTEIVRFSIIALIIVLPIRWYVAQPFIVSGASMEETFSTNEYLIVDQLTYHFESPARGDVVIFRYPKDPSKYFIKRVIGVPGDTLSIDGNIVTLKNETYPGGIVIDEPYISSMKESTFLDEELGDGEYFVMGDNRDFSSDSRMWGILEENKIVGRALLRLFPLSTVGLFPGEYDTNAALLESKS